MKITKIITHYGEQAQKAKAIEELCELATLLAREQTGRVTEKELIEEIADCYNMLDQLLVIYDIDDDVTKTRIKKIDRTIDRIKDDQSLGYIDRIPAHEWGVQK